MIRRLLAAALLAVAVIGAGAGAAQAAPDLVPDFLPDVVPGAGPACDAPTPEMPGRGAASWFVTRPATPPPAVDPFVQGSTSSTYQQFGFAGVSWHVCDLDNGVLPQWASTANGSTTIANWTLGAATVLVAATVALLSVALDPGSWMGAFYPMLTGIIDAFKAAVFEPVGIVLFAVLSIIILVNARKWEFGKTLATLGTAAGVTLGIGMVVAAPVAIVQTLNQIPPTAVGAVSSSIDGRGDTNPVQASVANLYDAILYAPWAAGMFGDADSDTAKEYGPRLWKASALSWDEAARYQADPSGYGAKLMADKKAAYAQAMADLEKADPDAYQYATGRRADERPQIAFLALGSAVSALPFLAASCLLLIASYISVVIGCIAFVGTGLGGIIPGAGRLATTPLVLVAAGGVNAIVMGCASAVDLLAIRVLLSGGAGIQPWLAIVLLAVLTVLLLVFLHPWRRLRDLIGGQADNVKRRDRTDRPEHQQPGPAASQQTWGGHANPSQPAPEIPAALRPPRPVSQPAPLSERTVQRIYQGAPRPIVATTQVVGGVIAAAALAHATTPTQPKETT